MAGEKGQAYATGLLKAVFQADFSDPAISGLFQNSASPLTELYISLHNADPGAPGSQTTNEVSYTSYGRVAVARSSSGFTVGTASVSPVANIQFPTCTGGTDTATHWGIGTASTGTGYLLYAGPITPSIAISNGVPPILASASTISEA